jgi:hypothetical protein
MTNRTSLFDLLDLEAMMAHALFDMQDDIDMGCFLDAMASQFEYLYLFDKWESLLFKHSDEYFYLLNMAKGRK